MGRSTVGKEGEGTEGVGEWSEEKNKGMGWDGKRWSRTGNEGVENEGVERKSEWFRGMWEKGEWKACGEQGM